MRKAFAFLAAGLLVALATGLGMLVGGHLGYQAFVIRTGSMKPTIPPQSLVVVEKGHYEVGQVVSFVKDGSVVSHRLVERLADGSFTTKGDANAVADTSPVQPAQIVGGVVSHVDRLGFWVVWLRNPLTLVSLALLGVFLWAVVPLLFGDPDQLSLRVPSGSPPPA
ncbi:signal peptidase I [Terrabacter aeriphilus]